MTRSLFALPVALAVLAFAGCGGGAGTPTTAHLATSSDAVAGERAKLTPDDLALVDAQEWCAVSTEERLGSMGPPLKLDIQGQSVFVCCKGCKRKAEADPEKTLKVVADLKAKKAAEGRK
jgi:hypothetical protein